MSQIGKRKVVPEREVDPLDDGGAFGGLSLVGGAEFPALHPALSIFDSLRRLHSITVLQVFGMFCIILSRTKNVWPVRTLLDYPFLIVATIKDRCEMEMIPMHIGHVLEWRFVQHLARNTCIFAMSH
jgi:hypothetical protein